MYIVPYGKQQITEEDIQAVVEILKSDFLTQGPAVESFELEFAKYIGSTYAVAVTNGTAALHLAALALGVKPGDKVLCTTNSFVASSNCILYCGGDVEFIDIDPRTFCLDLEFLETKLKAAPSGAYTGIVAVDFAGYPVSFDKLKAIADKYGLWIIEDACHAVGANFLDSNQKIQNSGNGVYSDISVFSFHPVKHIATGEGGMLTTNCKDLYEQLRLFRTHGITKNKEDMGQFDGGWYYEMKSLGLNYRISDILCALGSSQLKRIESNIKRRREIASIYNDSLKNYIETPFIEADKNHSYHLYVIQTEKRKELYEHLRKNEIFAQVHYIPIHNQPFYKQRYGVQHFINSERYYEKTLSLPMYHALTDSELGYVIEKLITFFK
jgi:UDP-4-amino-4,6-dideoxy-N-acetyl-beta-L-altrosamine transaminase